MLERRTPLDQVAGARDARIIDAPGLRVVPAADRGLVLLQADPGEPLLVRTAREQVGIGVPAAQAAAVDGEFALLWLAPKEFLLELPAARTPAMLAALVSRLAPLLAAVTDVSDAFAGFDVSGGAAPDVLMTGCTLNLQPDAFAPGRVARTALAGVPAILWKSADPSRFRCLVDRSYAAHLWNWLAQAPARA
jgi:sarcosine oxidase subunit gamma